jgi:hypothetical protein
MRIVQGSNVQVVADGATLALPADGIGLASTATIAVIYTNSAQATINSVQLTGSTDFSLTSSPSQPPSLTSVNPSAGYAIQYLPTISKLQSAKLIFSYTEAQNPSTSVKGSFSLNLTGTAPEFAYTFTPQPNGNTTLLNPGDTISVPQTAVETSAATLISITNKGSGVGVVNGITYKGAPDFTLAGLPFPPATVNPGAVLSFQVIFTPSDLPAVTGVVTVSFVAGRTLAFNVTGTGFGAVISYAVVRGGKAAVVLPGDQISLPDANVNDTSSLVVRVENDGNADTSIRTISVAGTGYALTQVPFLPATVSAGSSITFTVTFTPTQPGKSLGILKVGSDSFTLSANGLGPVLSYSYVAGQSTFQLPSGGSVVFSPVVVGQTNSVHFIIANTGTANTSVNSISASGPASTTFAVSNVPKLPASIAAASQTGFDLTFTPSAVGTVSGTLRIDNQVFTLTGIGNAPGALPPYGFSGSSGTIQPRSQPTVSLSITAPYPMDLTGTLNLNFNSAVFANDPSVQFQVGGRTVTFTIPANTTKAVFANQSTQIQLQSGSVAGTIVLTPTFATALGSIDITPANPLSLALTVPQQAPGLLSVVAASKTANSITLAITGYATSRSVTQMDFQFTAVSTENVGTTHITVPVDSSFSAWYQGSASAAFGSNFTANITFTLTGTVNKADSLADTIQSIAVTMTNAQGVSGSQTVAIAQ